MDASLFHTLLTSLLEPFRALSDPGKRIFWPFLVVAAALALACGVPPWLGGKRLWLHRSARLDYQLLFAKSVVRALLLAPFLVSTWAVAAAVATALTTWFGAQRLPAGPLWMMTALFTVTVFLVDDGSRYVLHRLLHRVPALWELHKVHHSAEVLTPLTLYRTHPIESALFAVRGALAVGATGGVFAWLWGGPLAGWEILGVDAIGFGFSLLGANLRHSSVFLSYGPRIEQVLLSPAQHQVHHSQDPAHFNRNFGTSLAIWDRLGGSLQVTSRSQPYQLKFGLPETEKNHQGTLLSALCSPLGAALRRLTPAGMAWSRGRVVLPLLSLLLVGCVQKRIDRTALLSALDSCAQANLTEVQRKLATLAQATDRAALRTAFVEVSLSWQVQEAMLFGPLASPTTIGGLGLRDAIYPWPEVNRCLIEQQLVSQVYQGDSLASALPSTRGLPALEYLLFYEGRDNGCPGNAGINTSGAWAALTDVELAARKLAYARALIVELDTRVAAVRQATQSFSTELLQAGAGSKLFQTQHVALSTVGDALFYLEAMVKDRKLAPALGLVMTACPSGTCPELLESPYADLGARFLESNLQGFQRLFFGCQEGLGFDDLLAATGGQALTGELRTRLAATEQALKQLPKPGLRASLLEDERTVLAVYEASKSVTDLLKGELATQLMISLPKRVEGDND